jgi:cell division protein FtsA
MCEGLLALDLGTHTTRALALARDGDALGVVGRCVRQGAVGRDGIPMQVDVARARLAEVLDGAALDGGVLGRRVVAAIGGTHVRVARARGSLNLRAAVALRPPHLERALDAAAAIGLPRDQEILHVLPTGYRVDGARTVRPPLDVRARRLVAEVAVVTASRLALDNLARILSDLGYELVDAAAEPLLTARAVLTPEDRQRGAVVVDIGAERIGAAVYRDRVLQGLASIGAGAAHISRDLAWALRCDTAQAEELKLGLGVAQSAAADPTHVADFTLGDRRARVGERLLARVIEPRMRELLTLTRSALDSAGTLASSDRVVLVGGGAALRGVADLAEHVFDAPARTAPLRQAEDATSFTGLGLVTYASHTRLDRDGRGRWSGAMQRLRRVLSASVASRTHGNAEGPIAVRSVHVPPRGGVDLEVSDVRVRTRV